MPPRQTTMNTPQEQDSLESKPVQKKILPEMNSKHEYTLVLDLDETLVHFVAKEKKFKLRPGCI